MGIRYLGSKARVLRALAPFIGNPVVRSGRFVDAFSGTGLVASLAADLGWDVHINDHLRCARLLSIARLLAGPDVPFDNLGGYGGAVAQLNAVPGIPGFLWCEYSPASADHTPRPRLYFTENNAARLDGMRAQVRDWRDRYAITDCEEVLLLADLVEAASSVANTAGTFGCFLSDWREAALVPAEVRLRALRVDPVDFVAGELDVFQIKTEARDTVYLDPPYTKRHYSAYYHILETLAHGDEPRVSGVAGLRPWRDKASPFAYKRLALSAMVSLVELIQADRVLVSYSSDGHIALPDLVECLKAFGSVDVHELGEVPRYQPRGLASSGVAEYLIELQR